VNGETTSIDEGLLTRVTLVNNQGIVYERYDLDKVEISVQDNERTLKVFVKEKGWHECPRCYTRWTAPVEACPQCEPEPRCLCGTSRGLRCPKHKPYGTKTADFFGRGKEGS